MLLTALGIYRWIASYSGDAKNEAVTSACNDANESSVVNPTSPGISTTAGPLILRGAAGALAGTGMRIGD